jgi:hypothetical protein
LLNCPQGSVHYPPPFVCTLLYGRSKTSLRAVGCRTLSY